MKIALVVLVVQNIERNQIIVYLPRCPRCQRSMIKRTASVAPAPDSNYKDSHPDNEYMIIGEFTFCCRDHPEQIDMLTRDQLSVINQYPVPRQIYRDTDLYNRKMRRKMETKALKS